MTSRLCDQSAAWCKNCRPVSSCTNRPTVGRLATMLYLWLQCSLNVCLQSADAVG